jgi:hypothetical protein
MDTEKFTDRQEEILIRAWLLAREREGSDKPLGQVLEPEYFPDAHDLAERGWLRREFVPHPEHHDKRELAWFWTDQAETALDTNALIQHAQGRHN